jgi:cholesterol transport system auxiliary component
MIRMRRWLLPCAAGLVLGACSSLTGKKEPFTVYAPRYTAPADAAKGASVQWQLSIDTPVASDALDTPRMLVMPSPGALETYKGARWSDTAPMLLRALMVQAFQQSGRISGVGASTSGLHGDYLLAVDLYDFETQYRDGSPHAVIRLNAKLTDSSTSRIAAARAFEADAPVAGSQPAAAAASFEQALAQLLPSIVDWALTEGEARWEKNAPQRATR